MRSNGTGDRVDGVGWESGGVVPALSNLLSYSGPQLEEWGKQMERKVLKIYLD